MSGAQTGDSAAPPDRGVSMEAVVSLCARRGFLWPSSEIYGGINGFWDYGPLGVELKNNLKARWWQRVVREREDVEGLDTSIIAHPRTWEASGHVEHFSDPLVDCRSCKRRFRDDQRGDPCPDAPAKRRIGDCDLTPVRAFNLMLDTRIGASEDAASRAYLRAETCQSIFLDFKRVRESARQKLPFGIAQIGKAFRNEINPRHFTFRSREFEQAELEFFVSPEERDRWFAHWLEARLDFHRELGLQEEQLRVRPHTAEELAHYARRASDIEFLFPFGWQEIEGVHDRGDVDLRQHSQFSGKDLSMTDEPGGQRFYPCVIETSVGVDRTCLALLVNGYREQRLENGEKRTVLSIHPLLAPIRVAVLPLTRKLADPARRLAARLRHRMNVFYDDTGNIGRRYRRQDEIGTPFCVTLDFDSATDHCVTVRDRDSMLQERVAIDRVAELTTDRVEGRS